MTNTISNTSADVLNERRGRASNHREQRGRGPEFIQVLDRGVGVPCATCYATDDEPCVSMATGKPISTVHRRRSRVRVVPRFVSHSNNRLTQDGVKIATVWSGNDLDLLRYDPPEESLVNSDGAYVTFVGSCHSVEGAHSMLRPGESYYAKWAADTAEGWTQYGQFLVTINTERGPASLFPDEYVVLAPDHLWYLVQDGTLRFTPNQGIGRMEFGERIHYVRSRGVRLADAILMCLGDVKSDIGYFTPTSQFDDMWWRFQSVGLTPMQKDSLASADSGDNSAASAQAGVLT